MNQFDETTLNEYLDGTLDETTRQQVEQWLAASREARAMLADLQLAFAAMANLDDMPLPVDLSAAIVAQLEQTEMIAQNGREIVFPTWMRWLLGVQVTAVIGIIVGMWPTLQSWFALSRITIAALISQINVPQLAIGELVLGWITAVSQQLPFTPPAIDLATSQWTLLLAATFLAWLAGNRLLFAEDSNERGNA